MLPRFIAQSLFRGPAVWLDERFRHKFRNDILCLCRACQNPATPLKTAYGRFWYQCNACGFLQAELSRHIWDEMLQGEGFQAGTGVGGGGYREYWISKLLCDQLGLKTILLYGTGNSPTLASLKDEGVAAWGCDVSRSLVAARQAKYGASAFFHPDNFPKMRFDAIIAVEVFEHFMSPLQTFHLLREHLSETGVIAGTTDLNDGSDISSHVYLQPGLHVAYWDAQSLTTIARRFGFDIALFQLECPGSVKPDEKYGLLWPRKRVFFLFPPCYREFFDYLQGNCLPLPKTLCGREQQWALLRRGS